MRVLAVIVAALICLASCATVPPPQTYAEAVELLTKEGKLDADQGAVARVRGIVTRLTVVYAKDYPHLGAVDAHVLRSDERSAWSIVGGHMIVADSFLRLGITDDELAMALAHELAHIALEHPNATLRAKQTQAMTTQLQYQLQNFEFQADKLGMTYAERAGYKRAAMVTLLRKMETATLVVHEAYSDHPSWQHRIEQAEAVR